MEKPVFHRQSFKEIFQKKTPDRNFSFTKNTNFLKSSFVESTERTFWGVCARLKFLIPVTLIAMMSFAVIGRPELRATEPDVARGISASAGEARAADIRPARLGAVAFEEPSRLLLLTVGILFVGVSYHRSWTGFRREREKS